MSRTKRKISKYRAKLLQLSFKTKLRDGSWTKATHSCTNNGGCPYCERNRLYKYNKQITLKQELSL